LTTLKDDQSTAQESVLVLLSRPPQPQTRPGQQTARIPFEVKKTEHVASTRPFVPPAGSRNLKPPIEHTDPSPVQPSPERIDPPAPVPVVITSPPPVIAVPQGEPVKSPIQTSPEHVNPPAPAPMAVASPPPAIVTPKSEPARTVAQSSPEHVDAPAPVPVRAQSPPPAVSVPRREPAKPKEEPYLAPVLVSQEGVLTPRVLQPILTRSVTVNVRVEVNEAGRVTRAEPIAEKGVHTMLLTAAADAARRCRFKPARQGQTPVQSTVTLVFHFGKDKD
jgi:TonB family protein